MGRTALVSPAGFVGRHKRELIANLVATADAAGAENPEALGRRLAVLFEGARALATSVNDARPFEVARELALRLIDDAVGGMSSD